VEKVVHHETSELEQARSWDSEPEATQEPHVVEDICVEELAIDGICGVY
jgi:mycofactocin precursor